MSRSSVLCSMAVLMIGVVYSQNDGFDLELVDISPCQEISHDNWSVSLYKSDILAVQADLSLCGTSWNINQYNGFRMHTQSQANSTYPVVFIARQSTSHGTLSFSIPLQPVGFSVAFFDVSRTVCPIRYQNKSTVVGGNPTPLFYIDVFTSSPELQNYSISIELVDNFTLLLDESYSTVITPSSPQIFYFKMPIGVSEVTIEATTDSRRCAIVSVQNVTCPVNDLLENARSIGIFQTMSTSAFLTVDVSQVYEREFLVVLIATNYSICHYNDIESPTQIHLASFEDDNVTVVNSSIYRQDLSIIIKQRKPISSHLFAILLPMFVVFPLFSLVIFFILFNCFPKARCEPLFRRPWCWLVIKCICPTYFLCWCSNERHECIFLHCCHKEDGEKESLTDNEEGAGKYQSVDKDEATRGSQEATNYELNSRVNDESRGEDKINLQSHVDTTTEESNLRLSGMHTRKYEHLEDQYCLYGWNTVTVGIFYALPALQLVLSEQKILNLSGDQNECYYNFKCAHPLSFPFFGVRFHFNTFNNVWSNIGYVLLGFLFVVVVLIRRYMYRKQRRLDKLYIDSHGVPQFFGIYFAMGFALILEGFMSSFYHICPNDSNFQFDTAFMFIIGGLLLVKVFQNRHPDIHANAFIAFFSFAVIIFCTLFGIYFGRRNPVPVRVLIFILALLLLLIFLVSFYYFHNWKWKKAVIVRAVMNIKGFFTCRSGPRHRIRFVKLIIAFCLNFILAILVIALYHRIDIATAVLAFFLINLLFFLAIYVLFKLWFKEPLTWLALVLPFLIAVVWLAAFYFFKIVPVTEWKLTPAESRELNKECTLLGFYDNHDIWHFLSAVGMFLAFLFLLVLDDGVEDVNRENLHIF